MLMALDGNNSLKCVLQVGKEKNKDGSLVVTELEDSWKVAGGHYVAPDEVDVFKDEVQIARNGAQAEKPSSNSQAGQPACQERWKNLSNELGKKLWGIFKEIGIFIAACRHDVVLLWCDMIISGELWVIIYLRTIAELFVVQNIHLHW